jgi:septum formation protein
VADDTAASERQPLVLASGSPRRRVLLAMAQVGVEVVPADIDEETVAAGLDPMEAVMVLARAKAEAVEGDGRPVLAADTIVSLDGEVLGKPEGRIDAARMLRKQSGKVIQVMSCVAVKALDGTIDDRIAISTLRFDDLDDDTIAAYLDSGEADDKAGALSVQGAAKPFTHIVDGSRSNVVGLPLAETIELLHNVGIHAHIHTGGA